MSQSLLSLAEQRLPGGERVVNGGCLRGGRSGVFLLATLHEPMG